MTDMTDAEKWERIATAWAEHCAIRAEQIADFGWTNSKWDDGDLLAELTGIDEPFVRAKTTAETIAEAIAAGAIDLETVPDRNALRPGMYIATKMRQAMGNNLMPGDTLRMPEPTMSTA